MVVLIAAVAALAILVFWLARVRAGRRRWLVALHLPGTWDREDGTPPALLEFSGELEQGRYLARAGAAVEEGDWRIAGRNLVLAPADAGEGAEYELRIFGPGSIGIHGPGREREVYLRRNDNVVPIHRRS